MTCDYCREYLCATEEKQWKWRSERIKKFPQIGVAPCPNCKGEDWITSREAIENGKPMSWWRRLAKLVSG